MPIHDFSDPAGVIISVYVPINAPALAHREQRQGGKLYKRVYAAPLAAHDMGTRKSDATAEDFRRVTTEKKNLTVGQMQEISKEMSAHRADRNGGVDEVHERFYRDHERKNGVKHDDVVRREKAAESNARLAEWGIKVKV